MVNRRASICSSSSFTSMPNTRKSPIRGRRISRAQSEPSCCTAHTMISSSLATTPLSRTVLPGKIQSPAPCSSARPCTHCALM
jgi:hypothetical protein